MQNKDTVSLLKECDSGIKTGIDAIDNVSDYVHSDIFKNKLIACKREHLKLKSETENLLKTYGEESRPPSPMGDAIVKMKTKLELSLNPTDSAVAELITDGCNMGVKSLSKFLNTFSLANEQSKDIAMRLIASEEKLSTDIRKFL